MTRPFLFLSDFDGTLSDKDFFKIIIDRYFPEQREQLYAQWEAKTMSDLDYLSRIFQAIGRDQAGIDEDILSIPFDRYAKQVIEHVQRLGGDFVVISAGTDYYIRRIFAHHGIKHVNIFSNPGVYSEHGIRLEVDPNSPYYSPLYGIDKAKVTEDLMKNYRTVFFAGDSRPDLEAACLADVIFARERLKALLDERHRAYVPIQNFADVEHYLSTHEETMLNV
ncbi:MAG: MtnX-like HAD-IB family phosphatase [Sporolactobacillus sp.]